jgi:CelD/BcsL family acetyltransferase involved in cellulose biosynthesis
VNLVGSETIEYFITTYDEAFRRYSVGILLINSLVRWSYNNGIDFDLRPFDAFYKDRWADQKTFHKTTFIFLTRRGHLMEIPLMAGLILKALMRRLSRVKRKSHPFRSARRERTVQRSAHGA